MTRPGVRSAIAWFFIIAVIILIQFSTQTGSPESSTEDSASVLQAQISGKFFIGMRKLAGQNPALVKNISKLEQEFLKSQENIQHLSIIPVIAEIKGKEAALRRLELMAQDPASIMDGKNIPLFFQLYEYGSDSLNSSQVITVKKYGWAGRLALSQDKPDSNPERKKVTRSAVRMVMLMNLLALVAVLTIASGLVLFIIAIVKGVNGTIKSSLVISEGPGGLLLETFALYLVLSLALPFYIVFIAPGFPGGEIMMAVIAGFLPVLWPLLNGAEWKDFCIALGWHRGKGFFREIGAGITGYIAGLPLIIAGLVLVMILSKIAGTTPSHPVVFELGRSPLFLFLLACVYAPFIEETLFRGALYGYLRRFLPWTVSGVITAFIFAIIHPQGWVAVPVIGIIGFNLCAIREWRGSAIAPMIAHALNNGSVVLIFVIALA